MAKIYIKFNSAVIKEIELRKDELSFGRKPSNDIVIDNPAISGFHGKITKDGEQFFIEDLNSTNGTFINGQRIKKSQLKNRDQISIARHVLEFVSDGSAPTLAEKLEEISSINSSQPTPEEKKPAAIKSESPVSGAPKSATEKSSISNPMPEKPIEKEPHLVKNKYEPAPVEAEAEVKKTAESTSAKHPIVEILSGGAVQSEVILKDPITYIGSSDQSIIKLKGLLAPSVAAAITKRPEGYFLKAVKPGYAVVNGTPVKEQIFLEHGAKIELGGITLVFSNPTKTKLKDMPGAPPEQRSDA